MPRFSDVIASLMTEFTLARVKADLESLKIAEMYRGNTLLQGAPLPRFRLPEVTIDLPLVITHLDKDDGKVDYPRPEPAVVESAIKEAAEMSRILLDGAQVKLIVTAVVKFLSRSWGEKESLERAVNLCRLASQEALNALPKTLVDEASKAERAITSSQRKAFATAVERRLNAKVLGEAGSGPRVMTLVGTGDIRELGDPSLVTRLNLTFKEDGFELVTIDRDDGSSDERLVPE